MITTSELAALVGAITGPIGIMIGLLVYFRDRAVVRLSLQWDMETFGGGIPQPKTVFVVTIYNIGRRAIYLSHAHIKIPKGNYDLLLGDSISGKTLPEGAPPFLVLSDQPGMEKYAAVWWKLRATVADAAGKSYHSEWPIKAPSWGKDVKAPYGIVFLNKCLNWLKRHFC